jgi:hypothetical protein
MDHWNTERRGQWKNPWTPGGNSIAKIGNELHVISPSLNTIVVKPSDVHMPTHTGESHQSHSASSRARHHFLLLNNLPRSTSLWYSVPTIQALATEMRPFKVYAKSGQGTCRSGVNGDLGRRDGVPTLCDEKRELLRLCLLNSRQPSELATFARERKKRAKCTTQLPRAQWSYKLPLPAGGWPIVRNAMGEDHSSPETEEARFLGTARPITHGIRCVSIGRQRQLNAEGPFASSGGVTKSISLSQVQYGIAVSKSARRAFLEAGSTCILHIPSGCPSLAASYQCIAYHHLVRRTGTRVKKWVVIVRQEKSTDRGGETVTVDIGDSQS